MIYGNDRRSSTWNLKALINGTIVFHARMYAFPLETQTWMQSYISIRLGIIPNVAKNVVVNISVIFIAILRNI